MLFDYEDEKKTSCSTIAFNLCWSAKLQNFQRCSKICVSNITVWLSHNECNTLIFLAENFCFLSSQASYCDPLHDESNNLAFFFLATHEKFSKTRQLFVQIMQIWCRVSGTNYSCCEKILNVSKNDDQLKLNQHFNYTNCKIETGMALHMSLKI